MFCVTKSPPTHWFLAPKPVLLKSTPPPLPPWLQDCAWFSAACRSAAVAPAGTRGAQSDSNAVDVVSGVAENESPENCDRSVFAYEAVALICGRNWLRATNCCPL